MKWNWAPDGNCCPEYGCLWDEEAKKIVIDLNCGDCGGGTVKDPKHRAMLAAAPELKEALELLTAIVGVSLGEPKSVEWLTNNYTGDGAKMKRDAFTKARIALHKAEGKI